MLESVKFDNRKELDEVVSMIKDDLVHGDKRLMKDIVLDMRWTLDNTSSTSIEMNHSEIDLIIRIANRKIRELTDDIWEIFDRMTIVAAPESLFIERRDLKTFVINLTTYL